MTFWKTASKAQKLTQIDAGIELGPSEAQVAKNLGATKGSIHHYAVSHGRVFPSKRVESVEGKISRQHSAIRRHTDDNTKIPSAFDIFGVKESKWEMEL